MMLRGAKSLAQDPMAGKWPRRASTQGPEPPLVLLPESNPSYPTLSQEGGKFKETRKSPEQVYFSFDKFCTEYITVRSSQLSPKDQKLFNSYAQWF